MEGRLCARVPCSRWHPIHWNRERGPSSSPYEIVSTLFFQPFAGRLRNHLLSLMPVLPIRSSNLRRWQETNLVAPFCPIPILDLYIHPLVSQLIRPILWTGRQMSQGLSSRLVNHEAMSPQHRTHPPSIPLAAVPETTTPIGL